MNTGKFAKVFGLGLSRTGTTTLCRALNQLGIKSIHFPYDKITQQELSAETGKLSLLKRYQSVVDISVVPFYKDLDRGYPGSKFILTVRDSRSWLKSVKRSLDKTAQTCSIYDPQYRTFFKFINKRVYGSWKFDEDLFLSAYRNHTRGVREYFSERPNDLLEMDILGGAGWDQLCAFLELPVPPHPFPFENKIATHLEWMEKMSRVQEQITALIPCDVPFVLVDHSALEIIDLGSHKDHVIRLVDWGHPTDDQEAITCLERCLDNGACFIVFVWPAFWWFEHYLQFTQYLHRHFPAIVSNEQIVVFEVKGIVR